MTARPDREDLGELGPGTQMPGHWEALAISSRVADVEREWRAFLTKFAGTPITNRTQDLWMGWVRHARKRVETSASPRIREWHETPMAHGERLATKEESLAALANIASILQGFGRGAQVGGTDWRCPSWARARGGHVRCALPFGHEGEHDASGAPSQPVEGPEPTSTEAREAEDDGSLLGLVVGS